MEIITKNCISMTKLRFQHQIIFSVENCVFNRKSDFQPKAVFLNKNIVLSTENCIFNSKSYYKLEIVVFKI